MSRSIRNSACLLSLSLVALFGVQTATAQQPPPAGQQPPGAANADLRITLDGGGGGSTLREGESYTFEAHVVNDGPGTARNVQVVVSTPDEFDLDEVNHEGECSTDPGGEGRMVCSYGDLPAGGELRLKFRGEFRDDEGFRVHVFVQGGSPDPDPSNNQDRQGVDVQENDGGGNGNNPFSGLGPVSTPGGEPQPVEECDEDEFPVPDGQGGFTCLPCPDSIMSAGDAQVSRVCGIENF